MLDSATELCFTVCMVETIGVSMTDENEPKNNNSYGVDMRAEEWRDIPGFAGYQVSNWGSTRVLDRVVHTTDAHRRAHTRRYKGMSLKQTENPRGYRVVRMTRNTTGYALGAKNMLVHRAVLLAFCHDTPSAGLDVRHLDGNKSNNRLDNLAYGTRADNEADKVLHGSANLGARNGMSKITEKTVRKIREQYAKGNVSQAAIAIQYDISREMVGRIVRRDSWAYLDADTPITPGKKTKLPPCTIDFAPVWAEWAYQPDEVEKWIDVPEFEGCYLVSNAGRVKSVYHKVLGRGGHLNNSWGVMRILPYRGGRKIAVLCRPSNHPNGKKLKTHLVHQLVARAFSGQECPEGYCVCHVNGDKTDNRIENLCYGSPSENSLDRRRHGTDARGEKSANSKLTDQDVQDIRDRYAEGDITQVQLADQYRVSAAYMNALLKGKSRNET
jgi:hypothetical protein